MSIRPSYGSNRYRSARGQPAGEAGWPSWREMRPVLLKSAGIVGIAGAIMAVVSSNALFMDPGGPARGRVDSAASEPPSASSPVVLAAADEEPAPAVADLRTGAPTVTPVPAPAAQPISAPPSAAVDPPATADITASLRPDAVAMLQTDTDQQDSPAAAPVPISPVATVAEPAAVAPADAGPAPAGPAPSGGDIPDAALRGAVDNPRSADANSPWPRDAIACPRDWVAGAAAAAPGDCTTIATLVESSASPTTVASLEKAVPSHVLELTALAPAMPVPDEGTGAANQDASAANQEAKPKPKPARVARNSSWPAEPPPDCGSKHAFWRFSAGHNGKKEWYCK